MASNELLERIRFRGQPLADQRSVVSAGKARFTVLTSRLVRMEWSATGAFDDRATYAFPSRLAPAPEFEVALCGDELTIHTSALSLSHQVGRTFGPGALYATWRCASEAGQSLPSPNGALEPYWQPGPVDAANLRGTRRTLDACEGDASLDEGLLSRSGWALFDDSRSIRFGTDTGWVEPASDSPYLDWYLFGYGHDYKAALAEYTRFGGPIPLIPRYVLGAWWSRYWAYSGRELEALVRAFERRGFPLDVLVIDMDWHLPCAWTGYTWNRSLFPDPHAFLDWVHSKGLRATLNLHPAQGVQPFEEAYPDFARSLGLDPAGKRAIPFRIGDPAFVKSYFELLHHPLEEQGVDFWWVDWQQGEASEMKGLDPLPWLNHLHFSDSRRRGRRPMLYSRWGGLGNHRYPIGFSGDTYVTWHALQFQPYLTATASNVAYGWWSHDIGGHMGGATEPELFARWVQFGALSPVLRLHATKDPRAERRPWAYPPDVCRATRAAFHLRYQLIPYLYTLARIATDTGLSPCRPMYYEHPEQQAAYLARHQYFLGEQLIVAPIVHPACTRTGLAAADVWLPPGTWIDYVTLEAFDGPGWIRIVGGLNRIPLLVGAGGIVPLSGALGPGDASRLKTGTTDALRHDRLILAVFPGPEGAFRLYEDDGLTEAYLDGEYEWTPIESRMASFNTWEVRIGASEGSCPALPRSRSLEVRLRGSRSPEAVLVDGQPHTSWTYSARSLTTTIHISNRDRRAPVNVIAFSSAGMSALGESHNLRLVRADVKCLLGLRRNPRLNRASRAALLEAALRTTCPGQADAIARLGGPLIHVIEHGELEKARVSLGEVIIAAPRLADESYDYAAQLSLLPRSAFPGDAPVDSHRSTDVSGDVVLEAPAAPLHPMRTARWHVNVQVRWRECALETCHSGDVLFPTIYAWQGLYLDGEQSSAGWGELMAQDGSPRPGLGWLDLSQTLDGLVNVYQPHILHLAECFGPADKVSRHRLAYLATTISSPVAQWAILHFRSPGPVDLRLNGHPAAVEPGEYDGTVHPRLRPTRRTEALRLHAGDNHLLVRCEPAQEGGRWLFGASLTSTKGEVLIDLNYRLAEPP
ncbi:MAG TPA: glycoside hydrolase family 31 protein [Anaerolineae bacterium]|nr:glycoside hydrolase family 31 protein [Anaerolineae bacterium]